jgi:hypothetical protein
MKLDYIKLFVLSAAFAGCAALAQNTASLSGKISYTGGSPVANATVTVEDIATGIRLTTKTDNNGTYRFDNVTPGRHRINVSSSHFTGSQSQEIDIDPTRATTVYLTVNGSPGTAGTAVVNTPVNLEETTPSLDTTTPQVTTPFNTRDIQYLPSPNYFAQNGQAFGAYNLSLQSAGTVTNGGIGIARGPVVGGQRPVSNNFYIEGIDNNNRALPGPLTYVPPDATTEFVQFSNQHPPEFGHTLGGQFNMIVRTGTNDFHGALYDYLQNRNLNAVDQTFARQGINDLPRFDQNRLGGNFGFPIIHNKLFFFGGFEYIPLGFDAVPSTPFFAPTAAGFTTLAASPGISATNLGVLRSLVGVAPASTRFSTINGVQVPVGVVPLMARQFENQYNGIGSLDWNIRQSDQVRARYVHNEIRSNNDGAQFPAFFNPLSDRALMASVAEYHNFTPVLVTEVRFGYHRFDQSLHNNGLTFPNLNFFPNIQIQQDLNAQIGPGFAVPSALNTYDLGINTNWTRGRHQIKFGFDGRRYIGPLTLSNLGIGAFGFSSLTQFLRNQTPDLFGARSFGAANFPGNNYDLYAYLSDSWHLTPNLNVTAGVKWAYASIPKSLELQRLNSIASVPGLIDFREPETQKHNFAPIVGIAWSPGFVKNTVFRAGFTMNYDTTYAVGGFPTFPPGVVTTAFVPTFGFFPGFFGPGGFLTFPTPVNVFTPNVTPAQARAATTSFVTDQRVPYSMNWDASVQGQIFHRLVVEARYLGVKTVHLPTEGILNAGPGVTAAQSLPLFFTTQSQATLNALPRTLNSIVAAQSNAFTAAGFTNPILSAQPRGWSWYNGLALQARQRFSAGFQAQLAYTWSHLIDNTSPLFNSFSAFGSANVLAPSGSSIYDHRQRGLATLLWDVGGVGKHSPSWVRDVLANFVVSGTYTYETPASAFVQSGFVDPALGNIGPSGVVFNASGIPGTGSGVTPLFNSAGQVVAFQANNPNAQFIAGAPGLATSNIRNAIQLRPINNFDTAVFKRFALRDRFSFEIHAEAYNVLNHPQFTSADIFSIGGSGTALANLVDVGSPAFGNPTEAFSSHARILQVGLRLLW